MKFIIFFVGILLLLIVLHLIGYMNYKLHEFETQKIKPYGKLVQTSHGRMHLYDMGSDNEQTIVILPGLGDALPCADFGPLMRDLSEKYHVVCVEYLGVGFSDPTDTPRTNENYVSEIREALRAFECTPPYILMPHSCSGVYCEYYAAKYPEEISHMIELDCTSTALDRNPASPDWVYSLSRFMQTCGVTRLTNTLMKPMQQKINGYTTKEQNDYLIFSYHSITPALRNQNKELYSCLKETQALPYPDSIPTLKLISQQAVKTFGQGYQTKHMKRLGSNAKEALVYGSVHMMHQKHHETIAEEVTKFIV